MNRHQKSFFIILVAIAFVNNVAASVNTEASETITWNIPAKWQQNKVVISYGTPETALSSVDEQVTELPDTFDSELWLETVDDTLTDYVRETNLPVYDTWTNASETYNHLSAPKLDTDAKTYMKFQTFGYNSGNKQSALSRGEYAYTGDYNIRMVDGRMLIAMGTGFSSTIGTYIDVELEDGSVLACILGDVKSDLHTDPTHMYQKWDMSIMEFIVDSPGDNVKDYSYFKSLYPEVGLGNFNKALEFSSKVKSVKVYDKVFEFTMGDTSNDNPDW